MRAYFSGALICLFGLTMAAAACAEGLEHSPSLTGATGLNAAPSARMDKGGTVSAGVSTLDPYIHAALGVQIADPLFLSFRQSAEVSRINLKPERVYPGVDLKLRLMEEGAETPALALGLQSALGHKRMAGEYLVASKRYSDFDFTAGIGWGRIGSGGLHLPNPLKFLGHGRAPDGDIPNGPGDWFSGGEIGLFAGLEYFPPWLDGLSFKADWGADDYAAERADFAFNAPAPWTASVNYAPRPWISGSLGIAGADKIMARLSLRGPLAGWPVKPYAESEPIPVPPRRTGTGQRGDMIAAAASEDRTLYSVAVDQARVSGGLEINGQEPLPLQIGRASRAVSAHGGQDLEEIALTPTFMGLRGPSVHLMRADLERAAHGGGSPQEMWRTASIGADEKDPGQHAPSFFADEEEENLHFSLRLQQDLSLSEEDNGLLYRTSVLAGIKRRVLFGHLVGGTEMRLNLAGNLSRIRALRPPALLPVRSDVDLFAQSTVGLERLYTAWLHSFTPGLHAKAAIGYLEEMYAGAGGEVLYRPFGKTFAIGAESWLAFKRDPLSPLAQWPNGDHVLSGFVNAWYEIPGSDLTLKASVGRYLAADLGGTLSLTHAFSNGATLEGFASMTDGRDYDLFGGTTHLYSGLRLSLPLDGIKYAPRDTRLEVRAFPAGRDAAQTLDDPLPLYGLTEPFSKRHIARHWTSVTE